MKQFFTFFVTVLLTVTVFAQSPEKMSYQAVIRDTSNNLLINQSIGMQISILQDSVNGTELYAELHFPTTNANGLVSVEIGNGIVVSGDFTTIDWANGIYFVKTETDPVGGTNYSILGASQLLSVPYALHSKTADSVITGINESDPVYGASIASGITGTDTTKWNNKQEQLTAGAGIDINSNVISSTTSVSTYSIGDYAQGGIVFWVDETGQHGLVCAKENLNSGNGIRWFNGSNTDTEAHGDGIYAGEMNTMLIVANQGSDSYSYAAGICSNYSVVQNGISYGDWYLPSKEELDQMFQNKAIIDSVAIANGGSGFGNIDYWSSTEISDLLVYDLDFGLGNFYTTSKHNPQYVRAIRAF